MDEPDKRNATTAQPASSQTRLSLPGCGQAPPRRPWATMPQHGASGAETAHSVNGRESPLNLVSLVKPWQVPSSSRRAAACLQLGRSSLAFGENMWEEKRHHECSSDNKREVTAWESSPNQNAQMPKNKKKNACNMVQILHNQEHSQLKTGPRVNKPTTNSSHFSCLGQTRQETRNNCVTS